jgi:hypothetical protein
MNYVLGIFIDFFIFWIQIWIWKILKVFTARYRYRTEAVKTVTAVYRCGNGRYKKPCSQVGETNQAGLANQSGRFCLGNPQKTNEANPKQNNLKTLLKLNRESHNKRMICLSKTLLDNPLVPNRLDRFHTGQTGFASTIEKNSARRKKLTLHLNRSPYSLHRFKWDFGDSCGLEAQAPKLTQSRGI